jgi:hypothetical protein
MDRLSEDDLRRPSISTSEVDLEDLIGESNKFKEYAGYITARKHSTYASSSGTNIITKSRITAFAILALITAETGYTFMEIVGAE